jgi:MFS transporter, FHS family, Na+ dependent glucose transporter 1
MNLEPTLTSTLAALRTNVALRRTVGYYVLFLCLGLNAAVIGPTLPALADQTHAALGQMGLVFLAGSIGYTLGTATGGQVFDRVRGHPVLGLAQLGVAAMIMLIPAIPWFWVLLAVLACKGFAEGLVSTGANTLLVWTHQDKVGPYMNGLHFCFGLGAFLSPVLVAQLVGVSGGYRYAYGSLAIIAALAGLRLLTLAASPQPPHHRDQDTREVSQGRIHTPLVIAAALFLFFYVGAEISFGGWVYTYAVTLKLASAAEAAYLTSGFWLSFTVGRLISIPLAVRFTPRHIILTALLGCLGILSVAMLWSGSSWVLWMMALGLGFCMAPIWPAGFTLAGQSFKLTAQASGIILLGDSLGGMVLPSAVGKVIEATGPQAMVHLVLASLALNLLAFIGMVRLAPRKDSTL